MRLIRKLLPVSLVLTLILTLLGGVFTNSSRANIYATNIKLNGSLTNATLLTGIPVNITYILNEPATVAVALSILSGTNVVRSIIIPSGNPGALMGTNLVTWDGKNDGGTNEPPGTYNVSITAAALGFTKWTQTSTDTNAGYHVFAPRGIAVNNNSKSPYYGRVFIGNAQNNGTGSQPGDVDGILKANADGSLADEGQSSGGYPWFDDDFQHSPHFLRYGQDDRIYALDLTSEGVIVALDMTMSTNHLVLTSTNYENNPFNASLFDGWGIFDVTDAGTTNGRVWLGNTDGPNGAGLWAWRLTNGVADPNDKVGKQVIAAGGALSVAASGGSMMDENSNIFIGQYIFPNDSNNRAMVFTNWNGTSILTNGTAWQTGSNDDTFDGVYDLAIDSRVNPKYVALSLSLSGGLRILSATDGSVVTTNAQSLANLDGTNVYFGVAWDAIGNLYGAIGNADNNDNNRWRAFSPPGPNQATTVAVATVHLTLPPAPVITSIAVALPKITINFTATAGDLASNFTLQSSSSAVANFASVNGASITNLSPGVFQATATFITAPQFFRIKR